MTQYFGTDGIRGTVGKGFITADFMLKLGWAVGKVMARGEHPKVLIGRDTRISGLMLQSALQAGLSAAGVETHLLGVLPTPAVAHLTHSTRASAGIVISASHNPYYDNGVKFFDAKGMKLSTDIEKQIEQQIEQTMTTEPSEKLGAVNLMAEAGGRYIEFCKSTFPSQLDLYDLKIVLDCAHGATQPIAPTVFHELGAQIITNGDQPNGLNINDGCGATQLTQLQQSLLDNKADLGIAFDGDGDRVMMVDHSGEIVNGDQILCILAKDANTGISCHKGVVGTLMSNLGLEQAMEQSGIAFTRTDVGDRFVLAELLKRNWTLGGESSGHIVNLDYTTTGDGIISALQILRLIKMTKQNLYQLKQQMAYQPQVMINVPVQQKVSLDQYPELIAHIKNVNRQLKGQGRLLVRPSGTEPYVRVMVEGSDNNQIQSTAQQVADKVNEYINNAVNIPV